MALKFLVVGPPCSGKTSVAKALSVIFNCAHVSSGDYARQINTAANAEALAVGDLSPDHLAIAKWVAEKVDAHDRIVIDGYPRSQEQFDAFDFSQVTAVIWLDTPIGECMARASGRGRSDDSPEVFYRRHTNFMKHTAPIMHALHQLPGVSFIHIIDMCRGLDNNVEMIVKAINSQLEFGAQNGN